MARRLWPPSEFIKTVLGLYVLGRAVGWLMMVIVERQVHWVRLAERRPFRNWHEMMIRWDAFYYQIISTTGYPSKLPLDDRGAVLQNPWAFFPVFPYAARAVSMLTGFSFETAAIVVNILAGGIAAICLAHLARRLADEAVALRTVAFWSFFPTAFVLQVPYSEALYLAGATGLLLLLVSRHYWPAVPLLIASSLTKGYGVALSAAAVVAVAGTVQAARARGTTSSAILKDLLRSGGLALTITALIAPFIWMKIAEAVTGQPGAYAVTQAAWGYSSDPRVWPDRWAEMLGRLNPVDVASLAALAASAALTVLALVLRQLPATLKAYTLAATGLIAATALPGAVSFTSLPRFAFGVLTFPLVLGVISRHWWMTTGFVMMFVCLEYLWVLNIWTGRIGIAP